MASSKTPTKRKRDVTRESGPSDAFGGGLLTPPPSQKKVAVKSEANDFGNSLQHIPLGPLGLVTPPQTQSESVVKPQIKSEVVEASVDAVPVAHEDPSDEDDTPKAPVKQDESEIKQEILDSLGITPEIAARAVPPNDQTFRFASGDFRGFTVDEVPVWYLKQLDQNYDVENTPGLGDAIIEWADQFDFLDEGTTFPDLTMHEINNYLWPTRNERELDSTTALALKYHLIGRKPEEPGENYVHRIGKEFPGCTLFEVVDRRGNESYLRWMKKKTHMAVREGNEHMAEGLEYYHRKKAREIVNAYPDTYEDKYEYQHHEQQSHRWNWLMDEEERPQLLGPLMYPTTVPPISTVTDSDQWKRKCPECGMRAPTAEEAERLERYGEI